MRTINKIVVHCSAGNQKQKAADIVYYHTGPKSKNCLGWSAPGYHYIVEADGNTVNTWPEDKISNGVKGYNSNIINVCWVGGIDVSNAKHPAIDNRTDAQKKALIKILTELKKKYPTAKIVGHRDFSEDKNKNGIIDPWERIKECPCFDAIPEYENIK
jgi:N-acetyl-anhydromuramyl-L-alanine amidase AmpD